MGQQFNFNKICQIRSKCGKEFICLHVYKSQNAMNLSVDLYSQLN